MEYNVMKRIIVTKESAYSYLIEYKNSVELGYVDTNMLGEWTWIPTLCSGGEWDVEVLREIVQFIDDLNNSTPS